MRILFLAVCTLVALSAIIDAEPPTSRAKRFTSFGSLSTIGGRVGCVVSQNKLFINGHFTKDLSDDEQEELKQYQEQLDQFKTEVKNYLEERQKQFRNQVGRQGGAEAAPKESAQPKKPEPPKKPSFCSDKATTQYVFDGCSVQGDNVYIGDTFVRKLSQDEQKELAQFDQKFTAYQKAVTAGFRKQVEEMFGQHFGALFGASDLSPSAGGGAEAKAQQAAPPSSGAELAPTAGGENGTAPEAPKTPSFCTLLV
uniref:Putative effector protein n=1 Tax=Heterodera avenae TaxID=34510 RepID=A0A2L0VDJ1_HETAV|nr:putative effector protein [Heterodera avenae]